VAVGKVSDWPNGNEYGFRDVEVTLAMGIVDPVGTQAANDADPFGKPPSAVGWYLVLGVAVVVGGVGVWLVRAGSFREKRD
jgi:hypothetical protein